MTEGFGLYPDSDFLGGELKLSVTIYCNKGLQPFADADNVLIYNTVSLHYPFLKRRKTENLSTKSYNQ
ncbi:MAG: hypothetical protein WCZ17_07900, partial [Candidatus Kapaibacterium sp.]